MGKHDGKILLVLAAIVAIGMARSYAGDVVTAGVVGFVAGVATILVLMSLSTRIAAKNPALALSAKERVRTEALKEREQIKAQLRSKPTQPQQPNENQQWLAQFEALR
jgi:phosphotransferase system  glucose/maltose/N-acetylglucosamine-specific IIC component